MIRWCCTRIEGRCHQRWGRISANVGQLLNICRRPIRLRPKSKSYENPHGGTLRCFGLPKWLHCAIWRTVGADDGFCTVRCVELKKAKLCSCFANKPHLNFIFKVFPFFDRTSSNILHQKWDVIRVVSSVRLVYSVQQASVPDAMDSSPNSDEDFSPISRDESILTDSLRLIIENQNQNFAEMLGSVLAKIQPANALHLPIFDPDAEGNDPRSWCNTIESCLAERPLIGTDLILALTKSLKGRAAQWLSQISFAGMTWEIFKQFFLTEYDVIDTPAVCVAKVLSAKLSQNESYSAFASRMISSLNARFKHMSVDEIVVSTVLGLMSKMDGRIRRIAHNTEVTTRQQLLKELSSINQGKRPYGPDAQMAQAQPPSKLPRFDPTKKQYFSTLPPYVPGSRCTICHRRGHQSDKCWFAKKPADHPSPQSTSTGFQNRPYRGPPQFQSSAHQSGSASSAQVRGGFRGRGVYRGYSRNYNNPSRPVDQAPQQRQVNLCATNPPGQLHHKDAKVVQKPETPQSPKSVNLTVLSDNWILMAQDQDPEISEIKSKIQNNGLSDQQINTYELRSGILCRVVQRGYLRPGRGGGFCTTMPLSAVPFVLSFRCGRDDRTVRSGRVGGRSASAQNPNPTKIPTEVLYDVLDFRSGYTAQFGEQSAQMMDFVQFDVWS
ncbi:unnamed protein product [Nesidiocoris tenuis]|uniref:Retrotransposon gag domain-containing protein n=1 Tax=Nesidiocoris tenuis TaxID=355587 RepID=A0A6H5G574_9HEMI|nr:unnamed protein product [Nesidiocoris tenuis]